MDTRWADSEYIVYTSTATRTHVLFQAPEGQPRLVVKILPTGSAFIHLVAAPVAAFLLRARSTGRTFGVHHTTSGVVPLHPAQKSITIKLDHALKLAQDPNKKYFYNNSPTKKRTMSKASLKNAIKFSDKARSSEFVVQMKGITKSFPGVVANDHIDFDLKRGEIHALLGENGAGKTTLMKILYGLYQKDEGEIYVRGEKVNIKSPHDAKALGIGMVHQMFEQVYKHSVAENIALFSPPGQLFPVEKVKQRFVELSKKFGWDIDPDAKIWQLSAEERQRVEILKVIYQGSNILIFDEPTSVLTPQGKSELMKWLKKMRDEGYAIIFITHKLDEVLEISDRVTVLRKGKKIKEIATSKATKEALASWMVGREVLFKVKKKVVRKGKRVLEVKDLQVLGDRGEKAVNGVSFDIYEKEIFGLAGVGGSGQKELIEALAGLRKVESGKFLIDGIDLTNASPREITEKGVFYVPEDREISGVILTMSVKENLILRDYYRPPYSRKFALDWKFIKQDAHKKISQYKVATPSIETIASLLSGGNLQKLILARETSGKPRLLIAAYPTRGLDVGSVEDVQNILLQLRETGSAIFLISEDLDTLMMMSDRLAVICGGRLTGIVDPTEMKKEEIGLMMAGTMCEEVLRARGKRKIRG